MAVWKLQHRETYPQKPYLFYLAFADQPTVDKLEESHIIHPDLEIAALPAGHFRSGSSWLELCRARPELAKEIEAVPLAVTLHGTVASQESLDYLRDSLEIFTSLVEHGARAVYDPLTGLWYSSADWLAMINRGSLFNPFDHIVVQTTLTSPGCTEFTTRGLRKFGRPDLVVDGVAPAEHEVVTKILDRFIHHLSLGGVIEHDRDITLVGWEGAYRAEAVQGDADDPRFHNSFVRLTRQQSALPADG